MMVPQGRALRCQKEKGRQVVVGGMLSSVVFRASPIFAPPDLGLAV